MELSSGLFASKTLAVAVQLDVFSMAAGEGITVDEFAAARGLHTRPAGMLLTGCSSLGLLEKAGDRFQASALAREYLMPGTRYYFGDFVTMLDERVYAGWMRLGDAVNTDAPTTWDPARQESLFDGCDPVLVRTFWRGMHSMSTYTARAVAEAYDFGSVRRLLDVGGGGAAFTIELCRAYPALEATVYDLPFVCEQTLERIAEAGLSDRITCVGGDFFADAKLPGGHEVALLSSVLHDWSPEENQVILDKVAEAVTQDGRILIAELLMDDDESGPAPAALFNLLMLVETRRGRNYTGAQYERWLRAAGCAAVERVPVAGVSANALVVGAMTRR
jgi:hypothetical protein